MNYLCGEYFERRCEFTWDSTSLIRRENIKNKSIFCKTEFLPSLASASGLPEHFTLLTHNSDINITQSMAEVALDRLPEISAWYCQNPLCSHPKIKALPIGIANPRWPHGNVATFEKVRHEKNKKSNLIYVNFNTQTNRAERLKCVANINQDVKTKFETIGSPQEQDFYYNTHEPYLRELSQSFFCISPEGNGADCHRHWESLYMKTIPIVTASPLTHYLWSLKLPLIIIKDWSDYKNLELTETLYEETWGDFDPKELSWDFFIEGI